MNAHYVPSAHSMPNSMQMIVKGISEQNYPTSLDPSYSRELYQIPDNPGPLIPTDHSLRPTHLPVNYDCGYLTDMSYQSRLSPVYEQSNISSLFDLQDTRMQNGYTEPELCEGLTRGLNIHKSNFPPNNPSKISQSGVLQKAQRDLDWKLKSRLSAEDLISKGILLGREQSPHILQNKIRLERAKTVDLLKKKILARPPKGKLIDGNILKELSGSPRLHQCQMSILKKQIMKQLNEKISERPRAQALIKKGILCPPAPTLNECLQRLETARNTDELMTAQHNLEQLRSNSEFYRNQNFQFSLSHGCNQSPAPAPGYDMSREERSQAIREQESSPDCSIVEESICQDNSALDTFTVSSKFPPKLASDIASRKLSHSKRINVRNPPNESTLKKDLISSSSLKTRSGKKPRKNIKTYKYHEYIPCPHSENGLTKNKILEKTHLNKTALSESKARSKNNLDMEVQQEQLLLQLHLLRQQYPALMPKIYNDLVSQLSQIDGNEALAKRRYTLEELDSMTVTSLKQLCKEHSLPSTGKKAELVTRLTTCNRVIIKKEDLTERNGSPDSNIIKSEVENKKYLETGAPPRKESDEQPKLKQSVNSLDSVPDQISAATSPPLSEASQYSAPSSDSYDNYSPDSRQGAINAKCEEMAKATSLSDPDHGMLANEFDSLPGVDAVKYLESSFNSMPNGMFLPDSSYGNIHSEYQQRNPGNGVKKQLFNYQPRNIGLDVSSSLPNINSYQQNLPPIPPHNTTFSNVSQDRAVSDLLRDLDSFEEYGMDLNRSLPAYQPTTNPNQPYEDPYYPGLSAPYTFDSRIPLKPMEYDSTTYLETAFPGDISCSSVYTSDMCMEYNTPVAPNDLFPLNEFHYNSNNEFGRIEAFEDIYHNSMHTSIDCDI